MQRIIFMAVTLFSSTLWADIYLRIEGGKVQQATLAIGKLHPLPGYKVKNLKFERKLQAQIRKDLQFTYVFRFIPKKAYKKLDTPKIREMNYSKWATTGASFSLRLGYEVKAGQLILEALLYDIPGTRKVFGTRYQYAVKQYPRLVHALAEDILKDLTGERGLFRSRLLMVCRDTTIKRKRTKRGERSKILPKNIYISDPDGRNFRKVTNDKTLSLGPNWAPDARHITYTQYEYRKKGKQFETVPVLRKHDLLTGRRQVMSDRRGMNSGAAWSPDGQRIALTLSYTGRPELYLLDSTGKKKPAPLSREIKWKRASGSGYQPSYNSLLFDVEPSWSPSGRKIVFSSARTGHPMIYIVEVRSKVARQLTYAGTYNSSPDWSPKGDKILFAAQRLKTGNFDIYSIDPNGSNLSRVTFGSRKGRKRIHSEDPSWGPTGRHFAYANNKSGKYAIYVSTEDGKITRRVSPSGLECTNPAWGPYEGS